MLILILISFELTYLDKNKKANLTTNICASCTRHGDGAFLQYQQKFWLGSASKLFEMQKKITENPD